MLSPNDGIARADPGNYVKDTDKSAGCQGTFWYVVEQLTDRNRLRSCALWGVVGIHGTIKWWRRRPPNWLC